MIQYLSLLNEIYEHGENHDDRTGVGTLSLFGRQLRHDMTKGFPLLTTKKLPLRVIFEELRWFLSGSTSNQDLNEKGVTIWDEWATTEQCAKFGRVTGNLGPVYGHQWRSFGLAEDMDEVGCHDSVGFDQINSLMMDIQNNPMSRRLIVSAWHPYQSRMVALPPCHTLFQIKCNSRKQMSLHLYMRSADIFLGVPFNIASYALLLKMICHVAGYTAKDLIVTFGDVHLYKNHLQQATQQLSRAVRDLPTLEIIEPFPVETDWTTKLLNLTWENIKLDGYDPYPNIKAPVAV